MDISLKKKALKQLARTESEAAVKALNKEAEKIARLLGSETQYDLIENQLALLEIISFRVSEITVSTIKAFLDRLDTITLTYQDVQGISEAYISKYQNKESLIKKSLEILERIRYHQLDPIWTIFLAYSTNDNKDIAQQAKHGLQALATFNLDIFYGDDEWQGLGVYPQKIVIDKIKSFTAVEKHDYFSNIVEICTKMLSPTIEGTEWNYKSVTLKTGAIPAIDGIKEIRKETLSALMNLYQFTDSISQKKTIISALNQATRPPYRGKYGDDVADMIVENTEVVLQFLKGIIANEELPVVQSIEHDVYWLFYHRLNERTSATALEIKEALDSNTEYQIFKTLIGFEGIFGEWESKNKTDQGQGEKIHSEIEYEKEYRERKLREYAESISEQNYHTWKNRIISYANIKSNDLATFPYFGKFLEHFGIISPHIALRLLREDPERLERFFVPICCGVWKTESKEEARTLLADWIFQGRYLYAIARVFEFNGDPDENLLKKIYSTAVENDDRNTIIRAMSVVAANYGDATKHLVKELFLPAIVFLTDHKDSRWVFDFWYRNQLRQIINDATEQSYSIILNNLIFLADIDFHAEEILHPIAEKAPELVIHFFCDRLALKEKEDTVDNYDSIPYQFYKLAKPLSKIPEQAVDIVSGTYDGNYGMFIYSGGRLLKNIFPDFPSQFEVKLTQLVESGKERDLQFVLAILRNYEGELFLHGVCKKIANKLPEGSKLLLEIEAILESTGVVSGEFGFAEAYERKKEEIRGWLTDPSERVRIFAKRYTSNLDKLAAFERNRAQESIELRKYEYGDADNSE